jgi:predicted DNA binding CopG/RHH family protein
MRFVLAPKDATVTLRLPKAMVDSIKAVAAREGVRYQGLMRQYIVEGLTKRTRRASHR